MCQSLDLPLELALKISLHIFYCHTPISISLLFRALEKKQLTVTIYTKTERCPYCCDDCEARGRTEPKVHSNPDYILSASYLPDFERNCVAETTITCTIDNYKMWPISCISVLCSSECEQESHSDLQS